MVTKEIIDGLQAFGAATIFNAIVEAMGGTQGGTEFEHAGGQPKCFTGPSLRCFLPVVGSVVGYAVTLEITPNGDGKNAIDQTEFYRVLESTRGPIISVIKDVDYIPGRGAVLGDGDAVMRKALGVKGIVVDGSIRDLVGIKRVGIPVWATGSVPGHGVFSHVNYNTIVNVAGLTIKPGDLLVADEDGCTKIPCEVDPAIVLEKSRVIEAREKELHNYVESSEFDLEYVFDNREKWVGRPGKK